MGILYIVPTPVGNMEDMTMRAIRVLKEADMVLAEDTRTSSVLLKHFDIKNRLVAHHKFNEHGTSAGIVERLKAGETIALISDAGTPGISDPGFYLAREAAKAGITVQTLPGPTACIPAIVRGHEMVQRLRRHPVSTDGMAGRYGRRSCNSRYTLR